MIDDLLSLADQAVPSGTRRKEFRWANLWPVFSRLRSRGFTVKEAIQWLHEHNQIAKQDFQKAENAFQGIATRKNKQARQANP